MTKKILIIPGFAALFIIAAVAALADSDRMRDGRGHGWGHGHGWDHGDKSEWIVSKLDRHLDLSDEQENRIEAIVEEKLAEMQEFRKERISSIGELIKADSIDERQVRQLMNFEGPVEDMKDAMAEVIIAVHAVLEPEQRAMAGELIAEHWGSWRGMRKRGHHDDHDR